MRASFRGDVATMDPFTQHALSNVEPLRVGCQTHRIRDSGYTGLSRLSERGRNEDFESDPFLVSCRLVSGCNNSQRTTISPRNMESPLGVQGTRVGAPY